MRLRNVVDCERLQVSSLLHISVRSAAGREYWRGYMSGVSRRMAGGVKDDELEAIAFDLLGAAPDGMAQILSRGYRDGLNGKPIECDAL